MGKYKYANLTIAEGTKKYGSTGWTGGAPSEYSTAIIDPGVWTGYSTGLQQNLSSYGPCKWGAVAVINKNREQFIAQNLEVLKRELATGKGEFSDVLISSYYCNHEQDHQLKRIIRQRYIDLSISTGNGATINHGINKIIQENSDLLRSCKTFDA
jgi:hypothetical protein